MGGRLYRLLLLLLPKSFRMEYAEEMARALADGRRDARGPRRVLLWVEAVPDVLLTAVREHVSILLQDMRYAWRTFRRGPGFAAVVVATIALGVGVNTVIFILVDRVLVRPLPYSDPERIVTLWEVQPERGYEDVEPSPPNFEDWRRTNDVFSDMAAHSFVSLSLTGHGTPVRLQGTQTTSSLFPLLGVHPLRGRWLVSEDDGLESPEVVILSHSLWSGLLGGDEAIIGKTLTLGGTQREVVGVMPASFQFPHTGIDFWIPMRIASDDWEDRSNNFLRVVARLRDGTSLAGARAAMDTIADGLAGAYPDSNRGSSILVRPLRDEIPRRTRLALVLLAFAALGVLLIGCANLANLLLARATQRRHEMAVRAALGAGSERLVRQVLTENLMLAAAGGAVGVLSAFILLPLLAGLVPPDLPFAMSLTIDMRILGFAFLLSLATGLLFAVHPAWRLSREGAARALGSGGRGGTGGDGGPMRHVLVVTEVALSVILLVVTGLLIRALWSVSHIDPGFRTEGVLRMNTSLPFPRYAAHADRERFYEEVLSRVRALPGVESAGYTGFLPFVHRGVVWPVASEEDPEQDGSRVPLAVFRVVTEGYLETMGIPILNGRDFDSRDSAGSPLGAVVSSSLVDRFWPGRDPVGRRFSFLQPWTPMPWTVMGVVPDIKARSLELDTLPQVYVLHRQVTQGLAYHAPKDLAVYTRGDAMALAPAIRRIIWDVDPEQPISDVQLMGDLLAGETASRRLQLRLLGLFAALALVMTALGIHGVLSYLVSRRSREIGLRMALGARTLDVIGIVLGRGLTLSLIGLSIGAVGGLGLGYAVRHLLFGVEPFDAPVFATTVILCLAAATTSCLLPAWRAARVDPMAAVRDESV